MRPTRGSVTTEGRASRNGGSVSSGAQIRGGRAGGQVDGSGEVNRSGGGGGGGANVGAGAGGGAGSGQGGDKK